MIRSLVPHQTGPTGGPAFTDVIGVCTSWGETVVVESRHGRVEIDRSLIVSGKTVPPPPARRGRRPDDRADVGQEPQI